MFPSITFAKRRLRRARDVFVLDNGALGMKARCSAMQSIPWDGKPITRPGLYRNIPLANYHQRDLCDPVRVSSSILRTIIHKSPAHAFTNYSLNPHRDCETQTESMALGRFLHKAVAGEPFDDDCVLCPPLVKGEPFNMRKTVWQDWKAEQEAPANTSSRHRWPRAPRA